MEKGVSWSAEARRAALLARRVRSAARPINFLDKTLKTSTKQALASSYHRGAPLAEPLLRKKVAREIKESRNSLRGKGFEVRGTKVSIPKAKFVELKSRR